MSDSERSECPTPLGNTLTMAEFLAEYEEGGILDDSQLQHVRIATSRKNGQVIAVKWLWRPQQLHGEPMEAAILARLQSKQLGQLLQLQEPQQEDDVDVNDGHVDEVDVDSEEEVELKRLQLVDDGSNNIIHYGGYIPDPCVDGGFLLAEYCNGGSVWTVMQRYIECREEERQEFPSGYIPEDFIWYVFRQMASALEHLASENVVHRNVKPDHMLLTWPKGTNRMTHAPLIKLAGFGLAVHRGPSWFDEDSWMGTETPFNMPPADVFSLGASIHEMAWEALPPRKDWRQGVFASFARRFYSHSLRRCINRALTESAPDRPTAAELVEELAVWCDSALAIPKRLPYWATVSAIETGAEAEENMSCEMKTIFGL